MITLLDGTKLPSHTEFYVLFGKIRKIFEKNDIKQIEWQFEHNEWDIFLNYLIEDKSNVFIYNMKTHPQIVVRYFFEYKSNISEWGKGIHDFLRQITKRIKEISYSEIRSYITSDGIEKYAPCDKKNTFFILLTFDPRFKQYEEVLKTNGITLMILPQELLDKDVIGD